MIYNGGARSEAAKIGGVTLRVVRDWVLRFNADGREGLVDRKAPDNPRGSATRIERHWPHSSRKDRPRPSMRRALVDLTCP
ncbi:helix-turn-helix domain-containing protein [Methylosinus sporium]|uniref:helix-turn-helix domain-containing protein n=1 Tax=Methylosinus sporium TaxID=428 RepID=UPI00383AD9A1